MTLVSAAVSLAYTLLNHALPGVVLDLEVSSPLRKRGDLYYYFNYFVPDSWLPFMSGRPVRFVCWSTWFGSAMK